jgi:trehalose-phosphatase
MLRIANLGFFWKRLAASERSVLFLDYDGTLAPFHVEREEAAPYAGVRERLGPIVGEGKTRIVLVSGRSASEVSSLLGLNQPVEVWGSHGLERQQPDRNIEKHPLSGGIEKALQRAASLARDEEWEDRVEEKHGCVAVHWRGLPEKEQERRGRILKGKWNPFLQIDGLIMTSFDGGLELRAPGRSKEDAVRTVLNEEESGAVAAYLGDDLTDEDGFRALGDSGLTVLVRRTCRRTAAAAWLRPPEELVEFLSHWLSALRRQVGEGE